MQFLFNMFNHSPEGKRSLEDVIGIIGAQLRALGHEAVWGGGNQEDKFYPPERGINVVVEGFTKNNVHALHELRAIGGRFIILATEEPSPKGFNQGTQPEMVRRQEDFGPAALLSDGIICLVPGQHVVDWYGQFAPAAYTELGYAPSLIRKDSVVPDFDFGFYGSCTPRRMKILKKLAKLSGSPKAVKIVGDFKTQEERDREMQRAKVILQLRKFEAMGLVSSSRCNTGICLGRPVVAEPHLLSKPWDEVIRFSATSDSFYSLALLARSMWKNFHAEQMAKFKEKFPPEACIGAALEKIGLRATARAA